MRDEEDSWCSETFEDEITRAMIAVYETKIDPRCQRHPMYNFTESDLIAVRKTGISIPAPDRLVWDPQVAVGQRIDISSLQLKEMPSRGCLSLGKTDGKRDADQMSGYCELMHFRMTRLPRSARQLENGTPFELSTIYPQSNGPIEAFKDYVTVNRNTDRISPVLWNGRRPASQTLNSLHEQKELPTSARLAIAFQYIDDMRHQWHITAIAQDSKITLGGYAENVKSLLYARSLPMTATGRKRPILHLVRAHKRRMKEGVDIDVRSFLRGVQEIEMDGTKFQVGAPPRLIEELKQQYA